MPEAKLIFDSTENNRDLFFAVREPLHDPHIYVEIGKKSYIFASALEVGRLKKAKKIDRVLDLFAELEKGRKLMERARTRVTANPYALIVHPLLKKEGITRLVVPQMFHMGMAEGLRDLGYTLHPSGRMYPKREVKSAEDITHIREAVARTEEALFKAHKILADAEIRDKGRLVYRGETVTAEMLKGEMGAYLMRHGYLAKDTIVAVGSQAVDPHNQGSGPIRAGELIVIDIFPGSMEHGYFADISRTFIKGEPTERQAAMYEAVLDAQSRAQDAYAPGKTIREVYQLAADVLDEHGFETTHDQKKGPYGFIHGLSHGLGLAVHDPISHTEPLVVGNVISNEPGLYYEADGGVRLEDDLLITEDGCENLCSFPKDQWIIE